LNAVFRVCNPSEYIYTLRPDQDLITTVTRTPDHLYIHELTVTAHQLASVAQLVRELHRNRRAVGSNQRTLCYIFAVVPGQVLKCMYTHLDYKPLKQHSNITE
jgi:hypothetical protein